MIPTSWTPITRSSDAEHVGYLAADGADGTVVATSLVGVPLGPAQDRAQDRAQAVAQLCADGLRSLDRRWWCRLPNPLPVGVLPAAEPAAGWAWRPVVLVEVSPEGCTVQLERAEPAERGARASLPVPVGDLLREHARE